LIRINRSDLTLLNKVCIWLEQRLEAALAVMNEQLKAQDAKIDRVNAKVELSKAAEPRTSSSISQPDDADVMA
jgi:hypothetical protein